MGCGCKTLIQTYDDTELMPRTLLDPGTVPPGGFQFFNEATRTRITSPTLEQLAEMLMQHRRANNQENKTHGDTMVEIQDQLCATAPPGVCRDVQGQVIMSGKTLTFEDIKRGGLTLLDWFVNGGRKRVATPLAEERSKTCAGCFANVDPVGCSSCAATALREITEGITGGDKTAYDDYLKSCGFCGCTLKSKVWLPVELLRKRTPSEEYQRLPAHCWIRTE